MQKALKELWTESRINHKRGAVSRPNGRFGRSKWQISHRQTSFQKECDGRAYERSGSNNLSENIFFQAPNKKSTLQTCCNTGE